MPELPEVEVLVRALRPRLEGARIRQVRILRPKLVAAPAVRTFRSRLMGRRIDAVRRRGKTVWLELDDGGHWLIHLRMTGWLRHHAEPTRPEDRHVLARIALERGELSFRDPRRFGRMWWTRRPGELFAGLGPEPLDATFTARGFHDALSRRRIPVKQAMLDPRLVAGVGNIYASESCFRARIDPRTPGERLLAEESARLRRALRAVLRRAIRVGSTVAPVVDGYRGQARFRNEFAVYGREGEPCPECGSPIRRVVLGQRSTFFCAQCQG